MDLKEVINIAEEVSQKYNPKAISPFPFEKIKEDQENLEIFLTDQMPDEVSGAIVFERQASKFNIIVNKNKPETRIYFTIAHELGHYFLHQSEIQASEGFVDEDGNMDIISSPLFRLDEKQSSHLEVEANNFAATLIMPEKLVIKAWEGLKNVEECARIFKVSLSAMSIRLERLGLIND